MTYGCGLTVEQADTLDGAAVSYSAELMRGELRGQTLGTRFRLVRPRSWRV
jgi:hypothetical protein